MEIESLFILGEIIVTIMAYFLGWASCFLHMNKKNKEDHGR